jgi:DNA-binding NarL/FixJ family response regulator
MGRRRIIILSGHSLFAEGIASRLKEYPHEVDVAVVDPEAPDCFAAISAHNPAVVILDASDEITLEMCPLSRLLTLVPDLKVIHLDSQKELIQVVTSEQHQAAGVTDLIRMLS